MDNFKEITEVLRRASLVSITKPDEFLDKLGKDKHKPKDTLFLVHALSLLFGVLNMLSFTFFITANDYWMYKFRDTVKDTVDLNNKTSLQKYFASGTTVVQTVPSIVTMLLSTTYGPRFRVNSRIILTLVVINAIFALFTVFIKINTDTWQVTFFAITLVALSLLTGFMNLFQVTSLVIISKFPPIYMKTFLFGEGMAPIFSASLQIISLALGTSTETSALFYFISGSVVIFLTIVLYLVAQRLSFYQHYMQIEMEDTKKKHTKEDIKTASIQIWHCLAILLIMFLTIYLTHPCITSLVVSEFYGNGNKWNEVYFVPTITFLFSESCSQFGRLISKPIISKMLILSLYMGIPMGTPNKQPENINEDTQIDINVPTQSLAKKQSNGSWIVGAVVLRMIIVVPLVLFCNAQPRNNIPVLLPHDWQYLLVIIAYFVSSGYILNIAILSIPRLAKENEDVAYLILLSVAGIATGVLSPLSLVAVRIL